MSKEIGMELTIPAELADTPVESLVLMVTSTEFASLFTHVDKVEYAGQANNGFVWNVYGKGNNAE